MRATFYNCCMEFRFLYTKSYLSYFTYGPSSNWQGMGQFLTLNSFSLGDKSRKLNYLWRRKVMNKRH